MSSTTKRRQSLTARNPIALSRPDEHLLVPFGDVPVSVVDDDDDVPCGPQSSSPSTQAALSSSTGRRRSQLPSFPNAPDCANCYDRSSFTPSPFARREARRPSAGLASPSVVSTAATPDRRASLPREGLLKLLRAGIREEETRKRMMGDDESHAHIDLKVPGPRRLSITNSRRGSQTNNEVLTPVKGDSSRVTDRGMAPNAGGGITIRVTEYTVTAMLEAISDEWLARGEIGPPDFGLPQRKKWIKMARNDGFWRGTKLDEIGLSRSELVAKVLGLYDRCLKDPGGINLLPIDGVGRVQLRALPFMKDDISIFKRLLAFSHVPVVT